MVSKLQNMRKDAGFEVSDRIHVRYQAADELSQALEEGRAFIMQSVLAQSLTREESLEGKRWDINGQEAVLDIAKA